MLKKISTNRRNTMAGRGKKLKYDKNARAWSEWMAGKKLGRPKQKFVDEPSMESVLGGFRGGHWEKVSQ